MNAEDLGMTDTTARDEALSRVSEAAPDKWKEEAIECLHTLIENDMPFTTDDFWMRINPPPEPRALGPIIKNAAKQNLITPIGYRPSARSTCHNRIVTIWRKHKPEQ